MKKDLIGDYWIDKNNNRWSIAKHTKKEAIAMSKTLIGCKDCEDSFNLRDCIRCIRCTSSGSCKDCFDCDSCDFCLGCKSCFDCDSCEDCFECNSCEECFECECVDNCYLLSKWVVKELLKKDKI